MTAWYSSSGTPGYIENLGLSGENNWSNVAASVPGDLARINLTEVKLFDPDRRLPKPLEKLINAAGISSPGALPSVPRWRRAHGGHTGAVTGFAYPAGNSAAG